MALTNTPFGFKALRHLTGGLLREESFNIASAYAANIFTGDPVKAISDGTIQLAAAGERILGIFNGCQYYDGTGAPQWSRYWPSGTTAQTGTLVTAYVYADPDIIFAVQSGGTPGQTNYFNLADHVAGTGSTGSGQSGAYLSGTMTNADAGFRLIKVPQELPGNAGQYAIVEVTIFEHEYSHDRVATPGV